MANRCTHRSPTPVQTTRATQVQIRHDAFTEEFINNEDGVRQNFIIENAPEGTRQLQVKMAVKRPQSKTRRAATNCTSIPEAPDDNSSQSELVYRDLQMLGRKSSNRWHATLAYGG
jgi:hypothetical protein